MITINCNAGPRVSFMSSANTMIALQLPVFVRCLLFMATGKAVDLHCDAIVSSALEHWVVHYCRRRRAPAQRMKPASMLRQSSVGCSTCRNATWSGGKLPGFAFNTRTACINFPQHTAHGPDHLHMSVHLLCYASPSSFVHWALTKACLV